MRNSLYLTPADQGRPLTLEELERAGGLEGFRYELIDGKIEVSPQANLPHDLLIDWLVAKLRSYRDRHPEVLSKILNPARVLVPGRRATTAPEPDIAAYAEFPQNVPLARLHWRDISPLVVAEVLSPDSADKDLVRNLGLYLLVPSIREYWIIDPLTDADAPTFTAHRRRGGQWLRPVAIPAGGTYTTRTLPGFSLLIDPHQ